MRWLQWFAMSLALLGGCSADVPMGRVCPPGGCSEWRGGTALDAGAAGQPAFSPGSGGAAGSLVGSGAAGSGVVGSSNALEVHVEDSKALKIEIITLACAGDCADIQAVASGGNPPYAFAWEDGSRDPKRHACLDAGQKLSVRASDTPVKDLEFGREAKTASTEVTANVLSCSDAGVPPPSPPAGDCGGDGSRNLIENGSFELPVVPIGSFVNVAVGETFAGWKVIGVTGSVSPLSSEYLSPSMDFTAHSGSQTLDLTGPTVNDAVGVEQTVATQVGKGYGLSFWTGNLVDPTGPYGPVSTSNVLIDGTLVLAAKNDTGEGPTVLSWQRFCVVFTAKSASTTIAFVNADPLSDNSNILDDVVLEPSR